MSGQRIPCLSALAPEVARCYDPPAIIFHSYLLIIINMSGFL